MTLEAIERGQWRRAWRHVRRLRRAAQFAGLASACAASSPALRAAAECMAAREAGDALEVVALATPERHVRIYACKYF